MRPGEKKITVEHVYPPIPVRDYDWCAYEGDYDLGQRVGYGATREAAIADLMVQIEEEEAS